MASTPSSRLRLTPSNSPFLQRPSRSPIRARASTNDSRLSLKRVVGTTCSSPTGFDTVHSSFAYIAGGAAVVVDVHGSQYSQRFYRARPTAVPVFSTSPIPNSPSTPSTTPKANDSRNRVSTASRDSIYGSSDWLDSPSSKTWTSRERIKAATCLSLSRCGRYLAVGETGYAPRVLIFSLQDSSSDTPLVSISEHTFGVTAVAWSHDTKYIASLGTANDGFLYLWKIDPRTGAAKLNQQNRCTSFIRGMIWMGNNLLTLGVRHVKVWRVDEEKSTSPTKPRFPGDTQTPQPQTQRALPGRNILLGSLLEATFSCAVAIDDTRAVICSETGDVCLLDDTQKQMKLTRLLEIGFLIHCVTLRQDKVYISGKGGEVAVLSLDAILHGNADVVTKKTEGSNGLLAMGFLAENLVTIDDKHSIDIWSPDYIPSPGSLDAGHIPIPCHGEPIVGIHTVPGYKEPGTAFFTWSASGRVNLWDSDGMVKASFNIPIEQLDVSEDSDLVNELVMVRATKGGKQFITGDKLGVIRVIDGTKHECLMEIKAHSSNCLDITLFEDETKALMASCGRDRTVQLFQRLTDERFEHFQTLEFAARVVQVLIPSDDQILTCSLDRTLQIHVLVSKEGEPHVMAAIPLRTISLKASPSSMAMSSDRKSVYVSLLDRSICQFDVETGRLANNFKCIDEAGIDSVVLDSLTYGQVAALDTSILLGLSNTDKSVRIYDPQTGAFLDREWGHTESINGVVMLEDGETRRKIVSVGSDGTIMTWALDLQETVHGSASRDPSPEKVNSTSNRPPLRRVLSKAELAEFQRPSPTNSGRRSPPRTLRRRVSRFGLSSTASTRSPLNSLPSASESNADEDTPSRRPSAVGSPSPPESPKGRARMTRRPSLPVLNSTPPSAAAAASRKKSTSNLRASYGFGSLSMATEQTCRQLRAYRKKLASSESISQDDVSEKVLSGLLDQYSERLVSMLDEKLRLRRDDDRDVPEEDPEKRPGTAGGDSNSSSVTLGGDGSANGAC
ncbi:WD40-repeat-containing domain protein [Coniochaeta sp. 2T2.1]|nr:WD40-repeat-containing domain protein [Coniochaeta sp. 2T2.1]